MARTGTVNYTHSTHGPVVKDIFWRECLTRERCNHSCHPLNNTQTFPSFKDVNTTANDYLGKTWHIMNHTYSSAAGKSSYFYNVAKPSGNVVRMGLTSASTFDAWRPTAFPELTRRVSSESPISSGRPSKGPIMQPLFRNDSRGNLGTYSGFDPFKDAMADNNVFPTLRSRVSQPEVPSFSRIQNT